MTVFRQAIGYLVDSPTYGRDRANLLSGFSIGTAALLLNGAVLMLMLPLMFDPDDRAFRDITENVEFGQLLALTLLGGAAAFATLLIPLRLMTVFWGPRVGRYFDQIVLSGISPLRFVIGKATSQNLFLALIVFLLLPYLVLSLTLGGLDIVSCLAGLFLVWLYCIALAVVTLWASLYLNELIAAVVVISGATTLAVLGCLPISFQPFVMTPFPALIHPVYSSMPFFEAAIAEDYFSVFISCAACMAAVICVSLFAISLGPLFGIIRENSTFGEVVRAGDSRRKRWFRLRLHIQRPSEIAFFYENRSRAFRRNEGLIRWVAGFCGLLLVLAVACLALVELMASVTAARGGRWWWVFEFHAAYLTIHGSALVLAIILFSHAKNSTYLRIPVFRGWTAEVSWLDTAAFLLFLLVSTAVAIDIPLYFEQFIAAPAGVTIFPDPDPMERRPIDYFRVAVEGTAVLSVAGLVLYALQRLACLMTWIRSVTFLGVGALYFVFVCMLPAFIAMLFWEVDVLREIQVVEDWAPVLAMVSPMMTLMGLFHEVGGRGFPDDPSTLPFYVVHAVILVLTIVFIRRQGRRVREMYLSEPAGAAP